VAVVFSFTPRSIIMAVGGVVWVLQGGWIKKKKE
jgi:uncharacterized membrane protein YdjX (TVP38/TMEM64 family)